MNEQRLFIAASIVPPGQSLNRVFGRLLAVLPFPLGRSACPHMSADTVRGHRARQLLANYPGELASCGPFKAGTALALL